IALPSSVLICQTTTLQDQYHYKSGQVPLSLGQCVQLVSLRLRSNMLNGSIPQSFSELKSIDQIDLSQNYLVGQIPEFFANMVYLHQLDLSANYFEGPIPTGGIFQKYSAVILDGNAGLCANATTNLFDFPLCPTTSAVESKHALLLVKLIPPIAIALLSFICYVVTVLKRRQAETAPCYKETMKKISYGDIVKATNWLSPVNKISSSRTGSIYIGSFATECEVLRNTRHRNLVKAVTVCSTVDLENNEFKAIVFDFMANGSLDMWVHPKLHNNSPKREYCMGYKVSPGCDVYGFGILLLEMLTGRRPTDAMFTGGLSLHKLVSSAFPDQHVLE
uniref:Serine-threonine/tyrosine-protein kinase catalytic domain-containing protein n=1 Tax=Aegilops tauschii subsp. strangulata TaxID=200361 RepID=A0A453AGU3_AEGTS